MPLCCLRAALTYCTCHGVWGFRVTLFMFRRAATIPAIFKLVGWSSFYHVAEGRYIWRYIYRIYIRNTYRHKRNTSTRVLLKCSSKCSSCPKCSFACDAQNNSANPVPCFRLSWVVHSEVWLWTALFSWSIEALLRRIYACEARKIEKISGVVSQKTVTSSRAIWKKREVYLKQMQSCFFKKGVAASIK